jgi:glycosyltransferase involved in cell wall biosynthesis
MPRPILFVSSYADPDPIGHNANIATQARELRRLGWPIEILTWPREHTWTGPRPADTTSQRLEGMPSVEVERDQIPYRVVSLPDIWSERVMTEGEWEDAVEWGMRALRQIRPQLIHVQFWQNLWWMLESANRLGIPTVYTAHDFGLACQRTTLLTGWNTFCDGHVSVEVCSRCVMAGRGALGRMNETVARLPGAAFILDRAFGTDGHGMLARSGGVRMSLERRIGLTVERARRALSGIAGVIVTSRFAAEFFEQFGVPAGRVHIVPWFHNQQNVLDASPPLDDTLRLGVVTRIAPEKGLDVLFDALERVDTARAVEVHIAGSIIDDYGRRLQRRYRKRVGHVAVHWHGWIPNAALGDFYRNIHAAIIPTLAHETGPISLIEARAHGRPVICTETPSIDALLTDGVDGLTFPLADAAALAERIERLANSPELVTGMTAAPRRVLSAATYAQCVDRVYRSIAGAGTGESWQSSHR